MKQCHGFSFFMHFKCYEQPRKVEERQTNWKRERERKEPHEIDKMRTTNEMDEFSNWPTWILKSFFSTQHHKFSYWIGIFSKISSHIDVRKIVMRCMPGDSRWVLLSFKCTYISFAIILLFAFSSFYRIDMHTNPIYIIYFNYVKILTHWLFKFK